MNAPDGSPIRPVHARAFNFDFDDAGNLRIYATMGPSEKEPGAIKTVVVMERLARSLEADFVGVDRGHLQRIVPRAHDRHQESLRAEVDDRRPTRAGLEAAARAVPGVRDVSIHSDAGKILVVVNVQEDAPDDLKVIDDVRRAVEAVKAAGPQLEVVEFSQIWQSVNRPEQGAVTLVVGENSLRNVVRSQLEDRLSAVDGVGKDSHVVSTLGRVLAVIDVPDDARRNEVRRAAREAIVGHLGHTTELCVRTFDEVWPACGEVSSSAAAVPATPPAPPPAPAASEWDRIRTALSRIYPNTIIDEGGVVRLLAEGKQASADVAEVRKLLADARVSALASLGKDPADPEFAQTHFFKVLPVLLEAAKAWCLVRDALDVKDPVELAQAHAKACVDLQTANAQAKALIGDVNGVYNERTRVIAALAGLAMFLGEKVGLRQHDPNDTTWNEAWRTIVFVELPDGKGGVFQASWHVHDDDRHLVEHLPAYEDAWDGHSTTQKYERIAAAVDPRGWEILRGHIVKRKEGDPPTVVEARRDAWHLLLDAAKLEPRP